VHSYQITAWGQPLQPCDYPDPEPRGSEVLLRVEACGVCHSDLHIWQGHYDLGEGERIRMADRGMRLPFTMGHEVAGEVVALGPDAGEQGVGVGDRVIVYPWIGCGVCGACRRGEELLCLTPRIVGTWKDGGYSDRVVVPHPRYLVPYGDLPVDLACTYACSGITALSALNKTGATREDDVVLLIGAGGVGLNAVHLAGAVLPGPVVVADVAADKRAAAEAAGAALVVDNGAAADAVARVKEFSSGGVAAAIDFVGRPQTARFGLDCLRKGGTLVAVGLYGDRLPLPLPWLPLRVLTLKGSFVGTLDDLKTLVGLAKAGKVPALQVERRPLAAANSALEDLAAGRVLGRVVLSP
jgi:propanol-preferring alcohol dehydrogenase